jgi:hypothetical protein
MHFPLLPAPFSRRGFYRFAAFWLTLLIGLPALAQSGDDAGSSTVSPGGASPGASDSTASKTISPDELASLVAPIALYPDALVAQILMASTYPLEIVEASRWVKANPDLKSSALEDAMEKQGWDPSVKSLTAFPQVLAMMNDKLTWTRQLGDAFLSDQKSVMNSLQSLRQKAKAEGNLETNSQQTVSIEDQPTGSQSQTIIIQPTNSQVVYVPTYNPTVVYGAWAYPMYPPYYWYPPSYVYTQSVVSFGVGFAVGAAMWGNCNWHSSNVNINVNRYNTFNRTKIKNNNWNHNSQHRRGVSYGDKGLQKRYGGDQIRSAKARESFRGRAGQGRQKIASGQADRFKGNQGQGARDRASSRVGGREKKGNGDRGSGRAKARSGGRRDNSAFGGMQNGRAAHRNSNRGFESRGGGFGSRGGGRGGGGGFSGGGRHRGRGGRRR